MQLGSEMRGWHGEKKETSNLELPMSRRYTMRREDRDVGGVSENRLIDHEHGLFELCFGTDPYGVMLHCF